MRWIVPLALAAIAPASALYAQPAGRMSYVLLTGDNDSITMNGSTDDLGRAEALRGGRSDLFYVREDGVGYVIRDPAILRQAEAIVRPQQELGRRQGELGRQQGELGSRQGALGAEQGRLGALQANSTPREMAALASQQAELGSQQSQLGEQQAALGQRQAELGQEQARAAEAAQRQIHDLVERAVHRGLAQRVD